MISRCLVMPALLITVPLLCSVQEVSAGDIKGTIKILGGKGLEHVVVYIEQVQQETFSAPTKNATVDQVRMTFVPHVLPILAGTTVDFPNSDSTRHNVFSPSKTKKFNLGTYPAGVSKKVTFDKTGVVSLLCNVHPEMSAYLLVLQNPYYAMPEKDGKYSIAEIPPGRYALIVWHPRFKPKRMEVTVPGKGSVAVDAFLDE